MPDIRLPDGSVKAFPHPVSVAEVAASIGSGLARAALGGKVDGKLVDTSYVIDTRQRISRSSPTGIAEGLEILRHSTAHLLAHAVKELFPDAQVTIGPVIEDGFYYDFSYKRPFTPEDLAAIEKRMAEISKRDLTVERRVWERSQAIQFFKDQGEHYKAQIIESIPGDEADQPVPAGQLHRPVPRAACAFHRQAEGVQADEGGRRLLARRFAQRDAAADLRHRLGEERGPGRLSASAGGGREARSPQARQAARSVPSAGRGAGHGVLAPATAGTIWQQIEQYMRRMLGRNGYQEVRTPQVMDRTLWERSGHWENYRET